MINIPFLSSIKSEIKDYAKSQFLPATAIATLFGILSLLIPFGIYQLESYYDYRQLTEWYSYVIVGGATLVVLYLLYPEHWKCSCHKEIVRFIHYFGFVYVGLAMTIIPYALAVNIFILEVESFKQNGLLDPFLLAIGAFSYPFTWMINDIFNSFDGRGGTLYNMKRPKWKWISGLSSMITNAL